MKAYQWLTLSAAIVITGFEALLFTSASRSVSPIETRAALAVPESQPTTSLASGPTVRNSPSKS